MLSVGVVPVALAMCTRPVPDTLTLPPLFTVSVALERNVPPDSFNEAVIDTAPPVTLIVPPECVTMPASTVKFPAMVRVFVDTVRLGCVPPPDASVTVLALAAAVLTTG